MRVDRTRNKLMKNGYLPEEQEKTHETWIDVKKNGSPISFRISKDGKEVNGSLRVHGHLPDDPMTDTFYSTYAQNVIGAIRLSRC